MSYILYCPLHKEVLNHEGYKFWLGKGESHRIIDGCIADFEVKEVKP